MKHLFLALLILLPVTAIGQQYLRPDGDLLTEWSSSTYTQIDEASYSDADYAQELMCSGVLNAKVYDGVIQKGTYTPTLTISFQTLSFTFTAPASNSNNLRIRFTVDGDDCGDPPSGLTHYFQVTVSDPESTPGSGTYTCRFRAKRIIGSIGEPDDIRVSWAEIEVPSGAAAGDNDVMIMAE